MGRKVLHIRTFRPINRGVLGVALALLVALVGATNAVGFGESVVPAPKGLAPDCLAGASLAPDSHHEVDWVIWCGPTAGRFEIQLHPQKEAGPVSLSAEPTVGGLGAKAPPTCASREGDIFCKVTKSGPVIVRGSFRIPGNVCTEDVSIWINAGSFSGAGKGGGPWGCPGREPPVPPTVAHIVRFHERELPGPALEGRHHAVVREAVWLREHWIEEEPVARWSAVAWGAPVDEEEAVELRLRLESVEQADRLIHAWLKETGLASIYAGWDSGPGGTIYVGFTRRPAATLARLRKAEPFVAPQWLKPFPVPPTHSERELRALAERIDGAARQREEEGKSGFFLEEAGVDTLANKVEMAVDRVAAARRWVTETFGAAAPIEVVKGGGGELL
jgi:hypothetical protein